MNQKLVQAQQFVDRYGGLDFPKLHYRPGASFTSAFGLTERYKKINGENHWGYPGIHNGVDRGRSWASWLNKSQGIFSPFDFYKSKFEDRQGQGYGCRIWLFHETGFVLRIAHCYPEEIEIMDQLLAEAPITEGTFIAPIGSYGNSTGRHSHSEIEAWGKHNWEINCWTLEHILREKFGERVNQNLTWEEIEQEYRNSNLTQTWNMDQIKKDYNELIKAWNLSFINKYKMIQRTSKGETTLYSTKALFGM